MFSFQRSFKEQFGVYSRKFFPESEATVKHVSLIFGHEPSQCVMYFAELVVPCWSTLSIGLFHNIKSCLPVSTGHDVTAPHPFLNHLQGALILTLTMWTFPQLETSHLCRLITIPYPLLPHPLNTLKCIFIEFHST